MLAILAALFFIYSLFSHRLERTFLTGPIIFTTAGIVLYFFWPDQSRSTFNVKPVLLLMELALAIVLFTDGSRIHLRELIRIVHLPGRLLVIAMPLIILAGTILAALVFTELSIWEAGILGAILAPTDASLGHAVMSSERVPLRIRQALNVEAGLNDGLALPFLMLFIALARVDQPISDRSWIVYFLQEVGLGIFYGFLFGWIAGWLLGQATKRKWMSVHLQQLALISIAILSWTIIESSTGNSFIGIFVVGLVIKNGYESAGVQMTEFSEVWGQLINLFVFAVFGNLVGPALGSIGIRAGLYATLSLTIIRILPVGISFVGTKLQRSTVLFMGWFGPRGLASIVLGLIYLKEEANLPGEPLIELAVMTTVLLSIFVHGITSAQGINIYTKKIEKLPSNAPEQINTVKIPVRY